MAPASRRCWRPSPGRGTATAARSCSAEGRCQGLRADELARDRALLTDRWIDPFASSVLDTVLTARFIFRDEDHGEAVARRWLERLDCALLADRDVRLLSRGERQRVAIATALAQDTPLVLLDEPTAHQDPRHQAMVVRELAALPERGLIVTLHDLNAAARLASHVLLLWGDGRTLVGPRGGSPDAADADGPLRDAGLACRGGRRGRLPRSSRLAERDAGRGDLIRF